MLDAVWWMKLAVVFAAAAHVQGNLYRATVLAPVLSPSLTGPYTMNGHIENNSKQLIRFSGTDMTFCLKLWPRGARHIFEEES